MLKHITGLFTPHVISTAGSHIDEAKKETQFIATILRCPVKLLFNNDVYLIDAQGNAVQENIKATDLLKMTLESSKSHW